ncbi:MAG: hypothetical protein QOE33_3436 [Acidobacteriota bacterium]|nr:hypothetical protein [Acidobacteriota bacterium]
MKFSLTKGRDRKIVSKRVEVGLIDGRVALASESRDPAILLINPYPVLIYP